MKALQYRTKHCNGHSPHDCTSQYTIYDHLLMSCNIMDTYMFIYIYNVLYIYIGYIMLYIKQSLRNSLSPRAFVQVEEGPLNFLLRVQQEKFWVLFWLAYLVLVRIGCKRNDPQISQIGLISGFVNDHHLPRYM